MTDIFEQKPEENESDIEALVKLANEALELDDAVFELEESVKALKASSKEIKERRIPELMSELQMSKFSLADGTELAVKDFARGSLPKDPEKFLLARAHLVELGGEALLKTEISMKFGKGETGAASEVFDALQHDGHAPSRSENVHPATLGKFVKELMAGGEMVNTDTLGVYVGRTAKFTKG